MSQPIVSRGYIEEVLWGLANLLAIEEHCVDGECTLREYASIRMYREVWVQRLNEILNNPNFRRDWCIVKHLLLAAYHALENASAVIRDNPDDLEGASKWIELSKLLFGMAEKKAMGGGE